MAFNKGDRKVSPTSGQHDTENSIYSGNRLTEDAEEGMTFSPVDRIDTINELTDVDTVTTTPANGYALRWNPTTQLWVPSPIHEEGVLSSRPNANARLAGSTYLVTDVNGGTLYRTNGTTWVQQSPGVLETSGRELAHAESLVNFVTSSATYVDVPGMTVAPTVGSRPIVARLSGALAGPGTVGAQTVYGLMEDSTELARWSMTAYTANAWATQTHTTRLNVSSGTKSWKLQARVTAGTNGGWYGGATFPAQLTILET